MCICTPLRVGGKKRVSIFEEISSSVGGGLPKKQKRKREFDDDHDHDDDDDDDDSGESAHKTSTIGKEDLSLCSWSISDFEDFLFDSNGWMASTNAPSEDHDWWSCSDPDYRPTENNQPPTMIVAFTGTTDGARNEHQPKRSAVRMPSLSEPVAKSTDHDGKQAQCNCINTYMSTNEKDKPKVLLLLCHGIEGRNIGPYKLENYVKIMKVKREDLLKEARRRSYILGLKNKKPYGTGLQLPNTDWRKERITQWLQDHPTCSSCRSQCGGKCRDFLLQKLYATVYGLPCKEYLNSFRSPNQRAQVLAAMAIGLCDDDNPQLSDSVQGMLQLYASTEALQNEVLRRARRRKNREVEQRILSYNDTNLRTWLQFHPIQDHDCEVFLLKECLRIMAANWSARIVTNDSDDHKDDDTYAS